MAKRQTPESRLADVMLEKVAKGNTIADLAMAVHCSYSKCPSVVHDQLRLRLGRELKQAGYKAPRGDVWWDEINFDPCK